MEQREEGEYPALYRPGLKADLVAAYSGVQIAERDPARRGVGVGVDLLDQLFADRVARQSGSGEHLPVGLGVTVRTCSGRPNRLLTDCRCQLLDSPPA
jgi:hypothetical protein